VEFKKMSINDDINYVEKLVMNANSLLNECVDGYSKFKDEKQAIAGMVKTAFHAALSLCDKYSLPTEARNIERLLSEADDLVQVDEYDGTGLFYLHWGSRLQSELNIIKNLYVETTGVEIPSSLNLVVQIIRQAEYTMEELNKHPNSEKELDEFMESLFKSIYPQLLSTPTLPKPIKNFEPDTGIPSLRLLIEYKYVASKEHVKQVVDEILADTAGYKSKDWAYFFFIVYEQRRFMSEEKWNDFLRQCGAAENTWVFVIHGIPTVTE